MGYLGNTPTQQAFTPAIDFFSGNGSTTAFTLSRPVASVAQVQATIENVPQNPGTAFTVSGNTITFDGAPASGTNNIYVYYTSPITQVVALPQSPQVFGSLQFSSLGARITGDMSNATQSNRLAFQTSTTNGNTNLSLLPNGTATVSQFWAAGGSDIANSPYLGVVQVGTTDSRIQAGIQGTASYTPMTFYTGGSERMRIDSAGNVGIGTSSPGGAYKLDVTGNTRATGYCSINDVGYIRSSTGLLEFQGGSTGTRFMDAGYGTELARITQAGLLQFNSGYGSVATAYGCRAWANFNGNDTPAIRASGNVSSITDFGQMYYGVNFTTAMPDAFYSISAFGSNVNNSDGTNFTGYSTSSGNISAGSFAMRGLNIFSGGANQSGDCAIVQIAVFR